MQKLRSEYLYLLQQSSELAFPKSLDSIAEYLIRRRIMLNLTQQKLAARLGFGERTIRKYEKTRFAAASLERLQQIDFILRQEENSPEHLAWKEEIRALHAKITV